MRVITQTLTKVGADADGFALNQAVVAGDEVVLDGVLAKHCKLLQRCG